MKELSLVYVYPVGHDSQGVYEYEFFFSETPETVWAEDWNVQCPSARGNMTPDEASYSLVKHLKTKKLITCAQENSCFSMADCMDGIIALCWENIEGLDEYPEPYRLILSYGLNITSVVDHLKGLDLVFEEDKPGYVPPEKPENEEDKDEEGFDEDGVSDEDGDNTDDDWDDDRYPLDLNF